jgi:DNA polymerase-3 subunit alpha
MKIKVLSPDINESHEDFVIVTNKDSLNKQAIRFGLNAIKNVGNAAVGAILEARKEGDFVSFADFLSRVDARKANKKVLESLIKVGALSSFGTRSALLTNMDRVREKVVVKAKGEKQQGLFGEEEIKKSSGASFSDLSGLQDVGEFADEELQELEKEFLGFSLSAKPISEVLSSLIQNATHSVSEVLEDQLVIGSEITLVGVVKEVREIITRKTGQEMAFVKIEDPSGVIDLVVFPKIFQEAKIYLLDGKPVVVKGKLDRRDDSFSVIANFISNEKLEDTKGRLFIRIPKGVTKEQLGKLREFLLANPGENPVTLVFESNRERINLARSISWDKDIAKSISDILSPDLASS